MNNKQETLTASEAWDWLIHLGVSEETLVTISSIMGHNVETYEKVLFSRFGYRTFDQMFDCEGGE